MITIVIITLMKIFFKKKNTRVSMVFPVNTAVEDFSLITCEILKIQMLLSNLKNKLNSLLVVNKNESNKITLPKKKGWKPKKTDNSMFFQQR